MEQLLHSDTLVHVFHESQVQPIFLFKHSAICSTSIRAKHQFEEFCTQNPEIPAYFVVVQTHRGLSNAIAETLGIQHQSPQLFLIHEGKVLWHTSHGGITVENIQQSLNIA